MTRSSVRFDAEACPMCGRRPNQRLRATREAGPDITHFVALAFAVMQVREFIALHRKATGRSDVSTRKVLALIDDALNGEYEP